MEKDVAAGNGECVRNVGDCEFGTYKVDARWNVQFKNLIPSYYT